MAGNDDTPCASCVSCYFHRASSIPIMCKAPLSGYLSLETVEVSLDEELELVEDDLEQMELSDDELSSYALPTRSIKLLCEDLKSDDFDKLAKATEDLYYLIEGDSDEAIANCEQIIDAGGHSLLLLQIEKFLLEENQKHSGHLYFILGALNVLFIISGDAIPSRKMVFEHPSFVVTVLDAMAIEHEYPGMDVFVSACCLLVNLVSDGGFFTGNFSSVTVIRVVVEKMKIHDNNEIAQSIGIGFLDSLIQLCRTETERIVEEARAVDAFSVLVSAVGNFPLNEEISCRAYRCYMAFIEHGYFH